MKRFFYPFWILFFLLLPVFQISAQTTVKKVILQGFWWDYKNNNYVNRWANYLTELAPRLKSMGIDAIWIPPTVKNENPNYVGYSPFDQYDIGDKYQKNSTRTNMGTKDELLRMIAVMHANGIEVIQDVVLNHTASAGSGTGAGGQDPNSYSMANSSGYKNFRYVSYATPATTETQTNYWNRKGRWYKNYTNFYPNPSNNCTSGDICAAYFGPDISYESTAFGPSSNVTGYNPGQASNWMRDGARNWLMWYKKQSAVDGFRWDAVKHFPTYVQEDLSYNCKYILPSWAQGGANMFNVGEWVGSKTDLDNYVNTIAAPSGEKMMGTFDFNLRAFDGSGGLYSMVYSLGSYNMANLPGAQQNERVAYYSGTNTYVHRTVPFVNNHDTFRPTLDANGNYTGWNSGSELSGHIEPNEPRMPTAYAVIMAMDGNPQLFFEDLFNIGYNSNRFNHDPKSTSSLPTRSDLTNLIWCHQNLDFKSGAYFVPFQNADYLVIERGGKAIIGITDNWDTWQNQSVTTHFGQGTVLKDYSGANGSSTVTVGAGGVVTINTPPVNPALNVAGRHGYSVWAPVGQDGDVYNPSRPALTTQEWEMADDLGDKNTLSLGQGGAVPANSVNQRVAGKIFVQSGKKVTYNLYPENPAYALRVMLYDANGVLLASKFGTGTLTGNYTPTFTGWITFKVRNNVNTNPTQRCWVNVAYTAPAVITNANALVADVQTSIWTGNAETSEWNDPYNWEEGKVPDETSDVIVQDYSQPSPAITEGIKVKNLHIEEGAEVFVSGKLEVSDQLINDGALSGNGSVVSNQGNIAFQDSKTVEFLAVPNPTEGTLRLMANGDYNATEKMRVRLVGMDGRVIKRLDGTLDEVNDQLSDALYGQASGIYLVHVVYQSSNFVLKVVLK